MPVKSTLSLFVKLSDLTCVYLFCCFVVVQGMVEPGQVVTQALKAEFGEEAMAKLSVTDEEREKISRLIDKLFNNGVEVIFGSLFKKSR